MSLTEFGMVDQAGRDVLSTDGIAVQGVDEFRDIGDACFQQVTNPASPRQTFDRLVDLDMRR
jgi:hypothetical protein